MVSSVPIRLEKGICVTLPVQVVCHDSLSLKSNFFFRQSCSGKTMKVPSRLDLLGMRFVQMWADLFPFSKAGNLLYLVCEKIHSVLHSASETMRWGSLINSSGGAGEGTHKTNVEGPGVNLNHCYTVFWPTPVKKKWLECWVQLFKV